MNDLGLAFVLLCCLLYAGVVIHMIVDHINNKE